MPQLTIILRSGASQEIEAKTGKSVMEAIRDNGIGELFALCGGCCSCGTCHVYVDPAHADLLPAVSESESDMLEASMNLQEHSRLSCQLPVTESLAGGRFTIAPEE